MADADARKAAMRRYAADVDGQLARFVGDAAQFKRFTDGMSDEEMTRFKKFADDAESMKRFRAHFADDESFKSFADGGATERPRKDDADEKSEAPRTSTWD